MSHLNLKALSGLLFLVAVLALALFLTAGTIYYWQAWAFLGVFSASVLAITLYLMQNDPQLLERRVQAGPVAEKEKSQNIIQSLASIAFLALFIVPALDHRFSWSHVPLPIVVLGDLLVGFGLLIVFFVFKENTYTSAVIEVGAEQKIISSGPYAIVRHPMYIGALIMVAGVPLALGSWWGLLVVIPMTLVIVLRLLDEEKYLVKHLTGYEEYQCKIRYRLLPHIW